MSLRNDLVYVAHMRDAASKVMRFTQGLSYEAFLGNEEKQWVVIRGIEIIGEATTKLSAEFVDAHPDFPWKHMRGMRNVLIHNYAEVDLRIVWDAVQKDLPDVERMATALLERTHPEIARQAPSGRRTPQNKREGPDLDR